MLEQYVAEVGGRLELTVVKGSTRINLVRVSAFLKERGRVKVLVLVGASFQVMWKRATPLGLFGLCHVSPACHLVYGFAAKRFQVSGTPLSS